MGMKCQDRLCSALLCSLNFSAPPSMEKRSPAMPGGLQLFLLLLSMSLNLSCRAQNADCAEEDMEYLEYFDLSNNELTGTLPQSPAIYNLLFLNLSRNSLSAPLPDLDKIGLETLDLSYNNVSLEVIPAWITSSSFVVDLRLAGCGISMRLNDWEPAVPSLYTSLDLSNNNITGDAGNLFQSMVALKYVNLASNQLGGSIPSSIGSLKSLEALDLSHNELNGTIPEEMTQVTNLTELNVSYNHLCGMIPKGKPFYSFPASAVDHNDCLYGWPLPPCHSNSV